MIWPLSDESFVVFSWRNEAYPDYFEGGDAARIGVIDIVIDTNKLARLLSNAI